MHHSFLQRLAFVKFLYNNGLKQLDSPEPLASAGLVMLHDAIEIFLELACEHLNVTEKRGRLNEYFGLINVKLESQGRSRLSQQAALQRLNDARVELKHRGHHPSRLGLESFRNTAREFFSDNCPLIFDVSLESVSMAEFVQPEDARKKVEEAIQLHAIGEFDKSAAALVVAFETMRYHYIDLQNDRWGNSPLLFGPILSVATGQFRELGKVVGRDAEHAIGDTVQSVMEMKRALQVMVLGIDFRRYLRFKSLVPICFRTGSGGFFVQESMKSRPRNAETIQLCIDFVIEASLQLSKAEYNW